MANPDRSGSRPRRAKRGRRGAVLALAVCLAGPALPAPAAAQGVGSGLLRAWDVTFDLLLLRPMGIANSAVGAAFFVPAAIISSPGGRDPIVEAWERFVLTPAEFAYTRPLGEF